MKSIQTPWGPSHSVTEKAPGIVVVTTASHGGFMLNAAALAKMPREILAVPPFAGRGKYEEDCDWSLVALAFPELFSPQAIYYAVTTVRGHAALVATFKEGDSYAPAVRWLDDTPEGNAVCAIADQWKRQDAASYAVAAR